MAVVKQGEPGAEVAVMQQYARAAAAPGLWDCGALDSRTLYMALPCSLSAAARAAALTTPPPSLPPPPPAAAVQAEPSAPPLAASASLP